jgi:hypothetical protein
MKWLLQTYNAQLARALQTSGCNKLLAIALWPRLTGVLGFCPLARERAIGATIKTGSAREWLQSKCRAERNGEVCAIAVGVFP